MTTVTIITIIVYVYYHYHYYTITRIAVDLGTTTLGSLLQQIGSTLRRGRRR